MRTAYVNMIIIPPILILDNTILTGSPSIHTDLVMQFITESYKRSHLFKHTMRAVLFAMKSTILLYIGINFVTICVHTVSALVTFIMNQRCGFCSCN